MFRLLKKLSPKIKIRHLVDACINEIYNVLIHYFKWLNIVKCSHHSLSISFFAHLLFSFTFHFVKHFVSLEMLIVLPFRYTKPRNFVYANDEMHISHRTKAFNNNFNVHLIHLIYAPIFTSRKLFEQFMMGYFGKWTKHSENKIVSLQMCNNIPCSKPFITFLSNGIVCQILN